MTPAEKYAEMLFLLVMAPREHQYGMIEGRGSGWYVGHQPACWACRVDDLLSRLGEQ